MQTWYTPDGTVVLEVEGAELHMTRLEAENLFVMLGHTLQDQDVELYDESGDDTPQPE